MGFYFTWVRKPVWKYLLLKNLSETFFLPTWWKKSVWNFLPSQLMKKICLKLSSFPLDEKICLKLSSSFPRFKKIVWNYLPSHRLKKTAWMCVIMSFSANFSVFIVPIGTSPVGTCCWWSSNRQISDRHLLHITRRNNERHLVIF